MTKLPSSEKIVKILLKYGFYFKSQKGSHQKYTDGARTVIVPAPKKEVPLGPSNLLASNQELLMTGLSISKQKIII